MLSTPIRVFLSIFAFTVLTLSAAGQSNTSEPAQPQYPNYPSETPANLRSVTDSFDYTRREAMIPMRDGVRLHTVILVPKGAEHAPILLTRTPYSANELTSHAASSHLGPILYGYDNATDVIVDGGYIRVIQDIRGKYGSEGDYVMNRPLHGPLNPSPVDESTDTYDSIDWLIKNIPETNGKVGILGISYDGFLPLMALVHPHPALKVSVPMNPMVDGWMGDDWFHNGAFREQNMPYIYEQEGTRSNDRQVVELELSTITTSTCARAQPASSVASTASSKWVSGKRFSRTPAMTRSGANRRWTKCSPPTSPTKASRFPSCWFTVCGIRRISMARLPSTRPSSPSTKRTKSSSSSAPGITGRRLRPPTVLAPFASAATPGPGSGRTCCGHF